MIWTVTAQIEGGKSQTGTVECESENRDYILRRFLARHIKNPGRRDFWYYRNKDSAVIKHDRLAQKEQDDFDIDMELKDPRAPDKHHHPDWPAVYSERRM